MSNEYTGKLFRDCSCGAHEGQLHVDWCPQEICPFCGGREDGCCACRYEHLGLKRRDHDPARGHLSAHVYANGLSDEQADRWLEIRTRRGRLPYIWVPQLCGRCGTHDFRMFMVPNAAWDYYVGENFEILCAPCFMALVECIERNQARPVWVPSLEKIAQYTQAWRTADFLEMERLQPGTIPPETIAFWKAEKRKNGATTPALFPS